MSFYFINIINWLEQHQLPCMFKSITHFDCPGCGIQRSFVLLLKGQWLESFKMYPALLPVLLLFAFLILHLIKNIKGGTAGLKYSYIFCAGIILVTYIYKLVTIKQA
jgi:Protein of unknown function (DUF2752)